MQLLDIWYDLSSKSDLALILFLAPVISTFFCTCTLFVFDENSKAKRALSLLLGVVCLCMIAYFISDYCVYSPPYCICRFFDSWTGLIISPLVYLYFATLIYPQRKHGRTMFYFYLPAIITLAIYILILAFGKEYTDTYTWQSFIGVIYEPEPFIRLVALIVFASEITYISYLIYKMAKEYHACIEDSYSYMEKINMNWLYYICVGLISFGVIAILGIVTSGLIYKLMFSFYSSLVMFVIFIIGLKQSDITPSTNEVKPGDPLVYTITDKYMSSEKDLMDRIDHLVEMEELFLNPGLTVQDVANSLRVNRTYISNIINRQKGVNFYQYINTYRINYAIELMRNNNAEKSLASIAEESGFKSKSTFYTFFKIVKNCTPGEYQSLYLNEEENMTDI